MRKPTLLSCIQVFMLQCVVYADSLLLLDQVELGRLEGEPVMMETLSERNETVVVTATKEQGGTSGRTVSVIDRVARLDSNTLSVIESVEIPGVVTGLMDVSARSGKLLLEIGSSDLFVFNPYDESMTLLMEDYKSSYGRLIFGNNDDALIGQKGASIVKVKATHELTEVLSEWAFSEGLFYGGVSLKLSPDRNHLIVTAYTTGYEDSYILDLTKGSFNRFGSSLLGSAYVFSDDGNRLYCVEARFADPYVLSEYETATGKLLRELEVVESGLPEFSTKYVRGMPFFLSDDSASLVAFDSGKVFYIDLNAFEISAIGAWADEEPSIAGGSISNDFSRIEFIDSLGGGFEAQAMDWRVIESRLDNESDGLDVVYATSVNRHYRLQSSQSLLDWTLGESGFDGNGDEMRLPMSIGSNRSMFARVIEFLRIR